MGVTRGFRVLMLLLAAAAGCDRAASPPPDTGSRSAVRAFYEALIRREWDQAYSALHPDSRQGRTPEQFVQLAESYRQRLGFEPQAVHVRACEERDGEAVAHVTLTGHGPGKHQYKDGAFLRRHGDDWRVLLPARFGRK